MNDWYKILVVVYVNRKRLRAEFSRQYPGVTDSQLALMFATNEDITLMKINTHGGHDAFVYFVQKNPAFFELDKILYPTGLLNISCFYISYLRHPSYAESVS